MTFPQYIKGLIDRHGTATVIADAIGMSLSAFQRNVNDRRTFGVAACLRLAEWAGDSPSTVLRLAGKGEEANLIERLYGKPSPALSATDRELLALDHAVKVQVVRLVKGLQG